MRNILVLGAAGQIGSELIPYLRNIYSADSVIASDIHDKVPAFLKETGPYKILDALDGNAMKSVVDKYKIDTIFNLVAVLSAKGEQNPTLAWKINMESLFNALEISRHTKGAVFTPSSIGAFGPNTPKDATPQDTIMRPCTIYGVSKVAAELLGDYYHAKFGVDSRGLRYPGIISYVTLPGGGTTDYAVEIYYKALQEGSYTCNLAAGSFLDMMYMPDALRAAVELMEADANKLSHRNSFNVSAMSFDPELIAASIKKELPHFELKYDIDPIKQSIADSWPNSMDDSCARTQWNWKPEYDLDGMTKDMLAKLRLKLAI